MRRWGLRGLLASWAVYWVALIGIRLGAAVGPIWTATHSPTHGTVNLSLGSGALSLIVTTGGATTYSTSIGVLPMALWITLPPLALCFAWFASRASSRRDANPALLPQSASEVPPTRDANRQHVRRP